MSRFIDPYSIPSHRRRRYEARKPPLFIDTHGHVNFNAFKDDAHEVIKRAFDANIWIIMPGSQYSTSKRAVEIAERYREGVYAAVGIHPIHLEQRKVDVWEVQSEQVRREAWMTFETRGEEFEYESYKALAQSKKVVAIGEVGLDYYYEPKGKAKREEYRNRQKETLQKEIDLALELDLPVIFHCRVAHDDLIELLNTKYETSHTRPKGVIHSYTGTIEQAERFLEMGFFIGFNGLIFKNIPALPDPKKVIAQIPLDRILIETDSPYLVPPQANTQRNEPLFVKYIGEEIARIKKTSFAEVAEITTKNAQTVFRLSD